MSQRYACLIVDDEAPGRGLIEAHLSHLPQFELVGSCADAMAASEVLARKPVDLMFLDIEMPTMKGTDFYHSLSKPPPVIFTTAYRDYAVQGFELDAVDYLLKPIVFERFFKATQRFLTQQKSGAPNSDGTAAEPALGDLFVRVDRKDIRLNRAEILYVRSMGDYQEVHTTKQRYMVKSTLTSFAAKLGPDFLRTHRSYLVNRRQVTAVSSHEVHLGNEELPIGEAYRDALAAVLSGT